MDVKMKSALGGNTSKTSALNHMLLRAWRERWTDAQFGINIKTVLPRGVSGDVYNLADCILQQALVGSDANKLVLSYLRHSLCAHLISHAAVLKRISKYDRFENVFCMIALLEFLEAMLGGITCRSKPEESTLGNAVLSIVVWLAEAYKKMLEQNRINSGLSTEQTEMAERCTIVLDQIVGHQFMRAIVVVAMHEDPELFADLRKSYLQIKNDTINTGFILDTHHAASSNTGHGTSTATTPLKPFDELLKTVANINASKMPVMCATSNTYYESIAYCLQPLLAVKVLQNPNTDTKAYVADLQMIRHMKNYTLSRLYYEIFRACLMSLYVSSAARESIWCAFTFIKVPHVIRELSFGSGARKRNATGTAGSADSPQSKIGHCPDVVAAFELLAEDPILDFIDTKFACNTVEYLLTELAKHGLVNDEQVKRFSAKRLDINSALAKIDQTNPTTIIRFVICAETPFTGILKALCADYSKMQEPLLGMFVQVLSGNSLELILSVASVEGKLRTFVARLINCNEQSLHAEAADKDKPTTVKASLFDVSFLMLTCIVQTYGSAVVLENNRGTSFFERWVRDGMIERNRHKSPMTMIHRRGTTTGGSADQIKIDELLMHLNAGRGSNSDGSAGAAASPLANCGHIAWQDVCQSLPALLHHILLAWENDTITAADVKACLESIKSRMCAFSVCAASWLNAYMLVVRDAELNKPLQMLAQLLLPVVQPDDLTQKENFQERHLLAAQIIRKMQHDAHPVRRAAALGPSAAAAVRGAGLLTQNLVTVEPLAQQFDDMWQQTMQRGWLPIDSIQTLDALMQSCGPFWLVARLIDEILRCKFTKEMLRTMDIVFALMHMNIERCTVALLSEWLPMLLLNRLQNVELLAPHSSVLARLCVMCILATMDTPADVASSGRASAAQKRRLSPSTDTGDDHTTSSCSPSGGPTGDLDLDSVGPMLKSRKLDGGSGSGERNVDDPSAALSSGDFVFDMAPPASRTPPLVVQEPLQCTLVQLFKQFGHFVCVDPLSPKIFFIAQFLTLLVQLGGDQVKPLLRLAPAGLMQNLLRVTVCDEFTVGFILRVYDLDTISGRRMSMADLSLLRNIQLRNESIDL